MMSAFHTQYLRHLRPGSRQFLGGQRRNPVSARGTSSKADTASRSRKWIKMGAIAGGVIATGGIYAKICAQRESRMPQTEPLPLRYDPVALDHAFDRRPWEVLTRAVNITSELLPLALKALFWDHLIRGRMVGHEGMQKKYAVELGRRLTLLGPCFVKLGQAVSIRPDLLPGPVLYEMQKLCDEVPSYPTAQALAVIREELGEDAPETHFKGLSLITRPIAAASLGQVYKVRLRNKDAVVAVKVQRPDMRRSIMLDLYILRRLARGLEAVKKVLTRQRPFDVALLDAFATASLLELDYLHEAKNQQKFIDELVPKMGGEVHVPAVHHDMTTRRVLVMDWVEGEKLAQSPKDVINKLTPVGVKCFLVQLLEMGYFHSDPHPGNLLVTPDGRLALIDFGLCAAVPLPDTRNITLAFVHLMQGDVGGLIEDAVELGFLPPDVNVEKLQPDLQRIFDGAELAMQEEAAAAANAADSQKSNSYKMPWDNYAAVNSRRKRFSAVSFDLNRVFFVYPFLVPDYFALITRAMVVLEGIAVTGDPDFDLFSSAYPYALKRAVHMFGVANVGQIAKEAVAKVRRDARVRKEHEQI